MYKFNCSNSKAANSTFNLIRSFQRQVVWPIFGILTLISLAHNVDAVQPDTIPDDLKPWQNWVLENHPDTTCPYITVGKQKPCIWYETLKLSVETPKADFQQSIHTFAKTNWVALPGDNRYWPTDVTVRLNGGAAKPAQVIQRNGKPVVMLTEGRWTIEGDINWQSIPSGIYIPAEIALVDLKVKGKTLQPYIDAKQQLWLTERQQQNLTKDSLTIQVYRLLTDAIPAQMTTYIDVDIAGGEREENLGKILPEGFIAERIDSKLQNHMTPNGELIIRAQPGRWQIEVNAHHNKPLQQLTLPQPSANWPSQEVLLYKAQPQLRVVAITGVPSIDPQQYHLPEHLWQLPAYMADSNAAITFSEQPPNQASADSQWNINRQLWLDFSGKGFTYQDNINEIDGTSRRLNSQSQYQLGRVSENNQPRVITQHEGNTGVELRSQRSSLVAEGRLDNQSVFPATGWQTDVTQLAITLHLPPAWSLLAARGVDRVHNAWLSNWNLWSLFLVLIISLAVHKVMNLRWALLAFVTLLVSYQRPDAPVIIWLNLAAILALLTVAKGKLHTWLQRYQILSLVSLLLLLLPFSIQQVQQAIYPQLENRYRVQSQDFRPNDTNLKREIEAPEVMMQADEAYSNLESSKVRTLMIAKSSVKQPYSPAIQTPSENLRQVQTGPGLPEWHWKQASLSWNGPVAETEMLHLYLVPPALNRLGNLLSVILCWLLAWQFTRSAFPQLTASWPKKPNPTTAAMLPIVFSLLTLGSLHSPQIQAEVLVDAKLLNELEQRLTQPPTCAPACAYLQRADINLDKNTASLNLQLHAAELTAYPLPQSQTWQPNNVLLDGQPAALHKMDKNQVWVMLSSGRHNLTLSGTLEGFNQVDWNFRQPQSNVYFHGNAWRISGLDGLYLPNGNLVATRIAPSDAKTTLKESQFATFVRIERSLSLAKDWRLQTRIIRIAPENGAINLQVPLLAGEQITTANISINNQKAVANLAPNQRSLSWESILTQEQENSIKLTASDTPFWVEQWSLDHDESWHVSFDGLNPIDANTEDYVNSKRRYNWQPWQGESVTINAFRPAPADGASLTLVNVQLTENIGQRLTESHLQANLRSSIGQKLNWQLPNNSELLALRINNREQPLPPLIDGKLQLSINPGEQYLELDWKQPQPVSLLHQSDAILLNTPASNIRQTIKLPQDRWILALSGPTLGPALLIWGAIVVIILASVILGRLKLTPLNTLNWLLLGLGLSTTLLATPLLIAATLFALGWRGRLSKRPDDNAFKWLQAGLCLLAFASLAALILAVPYSLLSSPDMLIVGNGSSAYSLNWYQDHSDGLLPQPWVLSLPMWAYKLLMLAWSIWLANALLRWLPWGWQQLNHLGFWPEKTDKKAST